MVVVQLVDQSPSRDPQFRKDKNKDKEAGMAYLEKITQDLNLNLGLVSILLISMNLDCDRFNPFLNRFLK